jgi:hypothetical protein
MRACLIVISITVLFGSTDLNAQSFLEVNQHADFVMNDGTTRRALVNVKKLVTDSELEVVEGARISLDNVSTVTIDSVTYFARKIANLSNAIRIVEKVIEGRISLYTSPGISKNVLLYAEKDSTIQLLRRVTRVINDTPVELNEYVSYLQMMAIGCNAIDQAKIDEEVALSQKSLTRFIRLYNEKCGWQREVERTVRPTKKPQWSIGVAGGLMLVKNALHYDGKTGSANGIGFYAGPSIGVDLRKYGVPYFTYDLFIEKLSGEGETNPNTPSRQYLILKYNIVQLKHIFSAYYRVYRTANSDLFLGAGALLKHQVANNTRIAEARATYDGPPSLVSARDKVNFSPLINAYLRFGEVGLRYQAVLGSTQLHIAQKAGIEHRLSVRYQLNTFVKK